jgi:ribosomal peptide maturation radical SAM protein 1
MVEDDISTLPAVFLFSAPWMKATWPCLGIGLLKSFLHNGGIDVRCRHLHLEAAAMLGLQLYDALAETWGAGEALFGALLDPEDAERLCGVAARLLREAGHEQAACWAEGPAREALRDLVETWLDRDCPERFAIVGGSVGAVQLCSTLYLVKRVRERGHTGLRVLGGAGLVGSVAQELLARCPDLDAIVAGEGEQALLDLAKAYLSGLSPATAHPSILTRDDGTDEAANTSAGSLNLAYTPAADLDDFYDAARAYGVPTTALTLSFEHSRGCEWEHRSKDHLRGCTFCGLYRNSPNHRRKPVDKVLHDIEAAVHRYKVLNLAFVDAYLPVDYGDYLLDGLNSLAPDVSFFTELRCDLTRATVERLAVRARRVQLGVESFSTHILRRIGKGISAAQSIQSVRLCQEYGVPTQYNLMTHIPGVPREEIDELHDLLPTLFGLIPPTLARFYLDRNSLTFADPEAHGVRRDSLDVERPEWLASVLGDSRICQAVPFDALDASVEAAWARVEHQITRWREQWHLATSAGLEAPLIWRDGGDWASVIDAREAVARIYTLEGVLYDVFKACDEVISEPRLVERLPQHEPNWIVEALGVLVERRFVVRDGSRWILLAVRSRAGRAGQPR